MTVVASLHKFGAMNVKFGVVLTDIRSALSAFRLTTLVWQIGASMIEWKYTNGSCLAAY